MTTIPLTFRALDEPVPGPAWQALFESYWPRYREWFLKEGNAARPSYVKCRLMLERHMPELLPVWERLSELAGGGDLASRMLAMYRPPPYLSGCSQAVLVHGEPLLVRNYDYAPERFEGLLISTAWTGRRVIGMSDSLWGLLDGMNDAGLAASLTFGGRQVVGDGFGIPLVVRYLLETCATVNEAQAMLARLPVHLAHNLTLVDADGAAVTAYLAPDRAPSYDQSAIATNHQAAVEWAEHAALTRTVERRTHLLDLVGDPTISPERFVEAFLEPPLYSHDYSRGFGTLYTAAYRPASGSAEIRWPGTTWLQSFRHFAESTHTESLLDAA